MICLRCGECCLHFPCFMITHEEEEIVDGVHICPHFSCEDGKTKCSLYDTYWFGVVQPRTGKCSGKYPYKDKLMEKYLKIKQLNLGIAKTNL